MNGLCFLQYRSLAMILKAFKSFHSKRRSPLDHFDRKLLLDRGGDRSAGALLIGFEPDLLQIGCEAGFFPKRHLSQDVPHEVDLAALPGGSQPFLPDRGLDAGVGVGDAERGSLHPPGLEVAEEGSPGVLRLVEHGLHGQDLAAMANDKNNTALAEMDKRLWAAADQLWANSPLRSFDYSTPIRGMIFLNLVDTSSTNAEQERGKSTARRVRGKNEIATAWRRALNGNK